MKANFSAPNQRQFAMQMSFEDFLSSGVMRRQALLGMCEPEQIILDYVSPDMDLTSVHEIREGFAEACEQASNYALIDVELDTSDVLFIQRFLLPPDPIANVAA